MLTLFYLLLLLLPVSIEVASFSFVEVYDLCQLPLLKFYLRLLWLLCDHIKCIAMQKNCFLFLFLYSSCSFFSFAKCCAKMLPTVDFFADLLRGIVCLPLPLSPSASASLGFGFHLIRQPIVRPVSSQQSPLPLSLLWPSYGSLFIAVVALLLLVLIVVVVVVVAHVACC